MDVIDRFPGHRTASLPQPRTLATRAFLSTSTRCVEQSCCPPARHCTTPTPAGSIPPRVPGVRTLSCQGITSLAKLYHADTTTTTTTTLPHRSTMHSQPQMLNNRKASGACQCVSPGTHPSHCSIFYLGGIEARRWEEVHPASRPAPP